MAHLLDNAEFSASAAREPRIKIAFESGAVFLKG
jgi:hypothetical protein